MNGSSENNIKLIVRITATAWLIAKLISWKLWISYRIFPIVPVFDFLPDLPDAFHFILFISSLAAILLAVLFPLQRIVILCILLLELLSCLIDQLRWQPWQYQYLLIFTFLALRKKADFLKLTSFLIGATYLYSGIHKLSLSFLDKIWHKMILVDFFGLPKASAAHTLLYHSGLLLGFIEIAIGLGLLFSKNKKILIWLCIGMHGFILLLLGPLGANFNLVVWPWNIMMPLLVWILFYNSAYTFDRSFLKPAFHKVFFVLIGILPVLSFAGLWDAYLSFNLYSGNTKRIFICSNDPVPDQMKPYLSNNRVTKYCNATSRSVSINKLAFMELEVPVYPAERTFRSLKRQWQKKYPQGEKTFIVYDYPHQIENVREIE